MKRPRVFSSSKFPRIPLILGLLAALAFAFAAPADAQMDPHKSCGPNCKVHSNPSLHASPLAPHANPMVPNPNSGTRAGNWENMGPEGGSFEGVVVDPANADNVTLVGPTVQQTTDGGQTWNQVGMTGFNMIGFDSFDTSRFYAAAYDTTTFAYAFFATADGGVSWTQGNMPPDSGYPYSVAVHPTDPNIVHGGGYVYSGAYTPMYYKSTDGGANFTATDLTSQVGPMLVYDLSVDPNNPNVIYGCGFNYAGGYDPKVIYSKDGGASWRVDGGVPYNAGEFYPVQIAVDGNYIYAGGIFLYMSADGGATWTEVGFNDYSYTIEVGIAGTVYNATPAGIMISSDHGATWTTSVVGGFVNGVQEAASAPTTVYAAATYAGVHKSTDGGATWDNIPNGILNSTVYGLTTSPSVPEDVYCSPYGLAALMVSHESGDNWQDATLPPEGTYTNSLLINSCNKDVMLASLPGG